MIEEMRIKYNQEEICTANRHPGCCGKANKSCSCIEIVIAILAVVLFVLLVLSIIVAICCKNRKPKKVCCCR